MASDPWTHRLGILAWAPLPFDDKARNTSVLSSEWPCILYPSWSNAILRSGLITDEEAIRLIGCKRAVAVKDLGKNRVPSRLALGSGLNGSKYRPKVVAYYLGYGDDPAWCCVNVDSLKQYTLDSCVEKLREISCSCDLSPQKEGMDQHKRKRLLLAMYEASLVMERPNYDPSIICNKFGFTNLQFIEQGKDSGRKSEEEELTPEYFDDWRDGGDSQVDDTQTQRFSCPLTC